MAANYQYPEVLAIEQSLEGSAYDLATGSHILMAKLWAKGRVDTPGKSGPRLMQVVADISGTRAIIPVKMGALSTGGFVTRANMVTDLWSGSPTLVADGKLDYAKFTFATLRRSFILDWRTRNLLINQRNSRPFNLLDEHRKDLLVGFAEDMNGSNGLTGNNNAAEDKILGLPYVFPDAPASSANAPGGFAYNAAANEFANWRPTTEDVGGAGFTPNLLNEGQALAARYTVNNRYAPDMVGLSESGDYKYYSQVVATFQDKERTVAMDSDLVKMGHTHHIWNGGHGDMVVFPLLDDAFEQEVFFLRSDNWYAYIGDRPYPDEVIRRDGTNAYEYMFVLAACVACVPKDQVKLYNIGI